MKRAWQSYILVHVCLAVIAAAFVLYAQIMRFLPSDTFHCVLHDLLHLYCPFCGGTRGVRALLSLQFVEALRLCGDLILAALVALALDIRAAVLLCRKREGALFPRVLLPVAVVYFSLVFVLRNTLLLGGLDAIGDLLFYWQSRASALLALGFCALSLLMLGLLWMSVGVLPLARLPRAAAGLGAGTALILLVALLYTPWLLLGLLPVAAAAIWMLKKRQRAP